MSAMQLHEQLHALLQPHAGWSLCIPARPAQQLARKVDAFCGDRSIPLVKSTRAPATFAEMVEDGTGAFAVAYRHGDVCVVDISRLPPDERDKMDSAINSPTLFIPKTKEVIERHIGFRLIGFIK